MMKYFYWTLFSLFPFMSLAESPIPSYEKTSRLLEGQKEITSLSEIAKQGLNEGKTILDLWSGSYWPHYQGSLGVRYRDPAYQFLMEEKAQWSEYKELTEKLPLPLYTGRLNLLSPAEKYDLYVGDKSMGLTKYSWDLGKRSAIAGSVKTWRGICDGWASAAQKMPRPVKSVTVKNPEGLTITFYPEDIKALGSLMYGRSQGPVIFLGKRCWNPIQGFITGACAETNPGAFHLALVNRVGLMKKTFIADVSPGGEVWNYPIESYKISFYNVFDDTGSNNFEDVKEPFVKKNRFIRANRRHPNTHSIVGVELIVNYRDMRPAHLLDTDSTSMDKILTKTYHYDLELDVKNNILGGESMTKNLPDFIWAPNDITYPLSDAETQYPDLSTPELASISSKRGQPLAKVVEKLFQLSSR